MASVTSRRPVGRPTMPGPSPGGAPSIRRRNGPPSQHSAVAAALPLVAVGAIVAWWGWKQGAYFGVTFLPGAAILLALTAALLLLAPWPASLRGPARVALVSLLALSAWTLVSALWSPTPSTAIADAQRVLIYAVAFALGIWLCLLMGRRMLLALAPLAGAGAVVAVATLVAFWVGDDARQFFEDDATIRYPLGYRNAVAAFFIMAVWPLLVLAASRDLDWRLRGVLLGSATLVTELAILAQSRSSVFAALIGAAVLVMVHPERLRILGWLALALVPAALALPWLLDVFQHGGANTPESIPPLHTACAAMGATSLLGVLIGLVAARAGPALTLSERGRQTVGRALLACLTAVLLFGLVSLARTEGGPIEFFNQRADQLTAGSPDLNAEGEGSRFGLDLRTNRGDFWRVALDDFTASPVSGTGSGGFRTSYLEDREKNSVDPEDPHSIELLMAGELGLPGLLLFGAFGIGATIAVLRARRLGPSAGALAAGALAIGAYWLIQGSVEWFWAYPAITMPMTFALGAAAAPAVLRPGHHSRAPARIGLAILAGLAAVSMIPFLLSERYTNHALHTWRSDIDNAYSELQNASDLNPTSTRPLATEAVIAESAGDRQRALAALDRAEKLEPEEWTLYYLEARVLAPIDPAGAQRALNEAKALNPRGAEVDALAEELGIAL